MKIILEFDSGKREIINIEEEKIGEIKSVFGSDPIEELLSLIREEIKFYIKTGKGVE